MCGIVGYINATKDDKYPSAREHFMKYAMIMDTLRGEDSTGLITIDNKFDVKAVKSTLPGDEFINHKLYRERSLDPWACIGHNRAATKGSVSVPNAHPFYFDKVCMVHNGTLDHSGASLPTYKKDFDVDSMQIAYALSKAKPEDARKSVLEFIEGSFALVWTDERDNSVNMARNAQRPMHFTWNRAKDFMMFMSDGQMLSTINKSLGYSEARGETIYSIDSFVHLKFTKGSLEPEVTSFRPFTRPVYNQPAKVTGLPPQTAAEKAASAWSAQHSVVSYRRGGTKNTVSINHEVCAIPKGHLAAMGTFFHLIPEDRLMFRAKDAFHLSSKTLCVTGMVEIPLWGNAEWECMIMHVPLAQYNAYKDGEWQVRPVGMTTIVNSSMDNMPGLLAVMINPHAAGMQPKLRSKQLAAEKSGYDVYDNKGGAHDVPFLPVDDGTLIQKAELEKQLRDGCVNCLQPLHLKDAKNYILVNHGQDVLCGECKDGYDKHNVEY